MPLAFFSRPTLTVARQLLGQHLVKIENRQHLVGVITEVEAYLGEADLACHARAGRTPRTEVMYGPPAHLYVYFTYGLHWCINVVTERAGRPAAILLRAVLPTAGLEVMRRRRGRSDHLTDGPAKLAQAFGLDGSWNGVDLCDSSSHLIISQGEPAPVRHIRTAPRIGLGRTPEPWLSKRWNFSFSPAHSPRSLVKLTGT